MVRGRAEKAALAMLRTCSSQRLYACHSPVNSSSWRFISTTRRPLASSTSIHDVIPSDGRRRRTYATAETKNANIAVLGGGLTGLTTAYYLAKQLPPSAKITLYEGSDRLGGWIWTDKVPVNVGGKEGIVSFERGPRSLSSLSGTAWRFDDLVMYDLALDLGLDLVSVPSKPRYIYYPDHLVPLPPASSLLQFFREPLFRETLFAGLMVLLRAYRVKRLPDEDESVGDWIRRLSGSRTAADNLVSAMVHGIYGGDIYKLSARSVLDRVYWAWYIPQPVANARPMPILERDILYTLGKDPQIQQLALQPKGPLLHFGSGGLQTLTDALGHALQAQPNITIKKGMPIDKIVYNEADQSIQVSSASSSSPSTYTKVISTLSSQDTNRLTGNKIASFEGAHSVSMMTVNLWFPQENIKPPGFGYLIPRSVSEEYNPERALGVFFDSDVESRSPDEPAGTKLFVLMGGHYYDGKTPPTEEEAIEQARAVLERHLHIPRDAPCKAVARFARECIPQHYVGHAVRMSAANHELRQHFGGKLAVAGGSYTRIGLMASLRAGYDTATRFSSGGVDATGLEFADYTGNFTEVPLEDIAVRALKSSRGPF